MKPIPILTMNLQEHSTFNIQHSTSNAEGRATSRCLWKLNVGCWMLNVFHRFKGSTRAVSFQGILTLIAAAGFTFTAAAQIGDKVDKPGVVQTPIVPRELIPPSPALSPKKALKTFKLAPGFRIELVASDPLIGDPVAMAIGPDGRMWVVEMRSFMPNLDGVGEDAPVGRVVVLKDTDGDGRMDKRTVFLDHLIMPRAIMLVGDGALIGAPPKLWYCRDTNGDGKTDEQIEIADDYGIQTDPKRPEIANPERAPNAPTWALDNWIYSTAYSKRFRFTGGQWLTNTTTFRGQWGLSQDDDGHLFYNSNSDQMRADILPSQYLGRNPSASPLAGMNVNVAENQLVWPARVNPGINRGYQPEMLRDYKLKAFTAACAPWIYRGDLLGDEFYGNAFVCEPAGNLIKRNILTATNGTLVAKEAYHESEFLASTDERFRPVNLYTGPEGALYVVDFYRGVLEHRISLTSYLRKQYEERGLDKHTGLGRIYRIVPEGKSPVVKPQLHKETPAQWVAHLSHANSWWRTTAQRLLVERNDASVVAALKQTATTGANSLGRLHALWTLEGMSKLDAATAIAALKDKDARVRAAAVRLCEMFFKTEDQFEVMPQLIEMTDEREPLVQQQLALTLGGAGDKRADFALATLVQHAPDTAFLHDAALSGLFGRELELLERLLSDPAWNAADDNANKFLGALARCIFAARGGERTGQLLTLIAAQPADSARTIALLDGILSTAPATTKKPVKFKSEPAAMAQLGKHNEARIAKLTALMTWPGKPGALPEPVITPLTAAQQMSFDLGKTLYAGICAACHQPHGLGMEGLAPPLVDSEWVLGSEQRLTRIILHGVNGPIKVQGRLYSLDMPALGNLLDDESLAAVLTYIRREWEHAANPVTPAAVKAIRAANSTRTEGWRQDDLLKIP